MENQLLLVVLTHYITEIENAPEDKKQDYNKYIERLTLILIRSCTDIYGI